MDHTTFSAKPGVSGAALHEAEELKEIPGGNYYSKSGLAPAPQEPGKVTYTVRAEPSAGTESLLSISLPRGDLRQLIQQGLLVQDNRSLLLTRLDNLNTKRLQSPLRADGRLLPDAGMGPIAVCLRGSHVPISLSETPAICPLGPRDTEHQGRETVTVVGEPEEAFLEEVSPELIWRKRSN